MVEVVETCFVVPYDEAPKNKIWLSNLDLSIPWDHVPVVYLYKFNGQTDEFFSVEELKASLAKALVPFYPLAGRLVVDDDGRAEIQCTGEGALFVTARSENYLSDYEDFMPSRKMRTMFVPSVRTEDAARIVSMFQLTFFKCGGVCLGTALHNGVVDGRSGFNFIKTWCEISRGVSATTSPFLDRTLLRARSPLSIQFEHSEYSPVPKFTTPSTMPFETAVFKLRKEQISFLKGSRCSNGTITGSKITTYQAVATYVWKCSCMARNLDMDEKTTFFTPIDSRNRIKPPLPQEYFGNAVFITSLSMKVGELVSNPTEFGARKIGAAVNQIDDNYVRSLIDYLETEKGMLSVGASPLRRTDLCLVSWLRMNMEEGNFKWGNPALISKTHLYCSGFGYIMSCGDKDGDISLSLGLESDVMTRFKKIFNDGLSGFVEA